MTLVTLHVCTLFLARVPFPSLCYNEFGWKSNKHKKCFSLLNLFLKVSTQLIYLPLVPFPLVLCALQKTIQCWCPLRLFYTPIRSISSQSQRLAPRKNCQSNHNILLGKINPEEREFWFPFLPIKSFIPVQSKSNESVGNNFY